MTFIQSRRRLCRERISKSPLGSLFPPESSYNKTPVNPPTVKPLVAKYLEENVQKILKTVLKVQAPPSDRLCKKPLKTRLPDVYCGKSHMECYNFC